MPNRLLITLVVVTFIVFGCSRELPADPMCRANALFPRTAPSPAACLIKSHGQLLAIKSHDDDAWNIPNHKKQQAKSAQCTAHLAVWKTTGLNVEVGQLLYTSPNHTQYYACKLTDNFSSQLKQFTVPPWAERKTSQISLIDPFDTEADHWVNDINLIDLREAYNRLE